MVTGAVGVIHMGFFNYTQPTCMAACVKKRRGRVRVRVYFNQLIII
jgi:hypothetical protein